MEGKTPRKLNEGLIEEMAVAFPTVELRSQLVGRYQISWYLGSTFEKLV